MTEKILFFEGAGCVPRGDVENCRIRTAFTNDDGANIYLELIGIEYNINMSEAFAGFVSLGFVDHCHSIINYFPNQHSISQHPCERKTNFEYSKQGILDFVNNTLCCSFDKIIITDMFDGYRVHNDFGGYNFMEDFEYNPGKAEKARKAFDKIDKQVRKQLNEKYSKISLHNIADNALTVRCYASKESMAAHGLDPNNRYMTVFFD